MTQLNASSAPRTALFHQAFALRSRRWLAGAGLAALALAGGIALVGPARLIAQIEGERGIAPVVATGDIEVNGVEVEATGKTGTEARDAGWHQAYEKAWAQVHGPAMGGSALESLVSSVVVEQEQIGPHRYHARLGIVFDRGRAGAYLSDNGAAVRRSAPMLLVPVLYSGGVAQVYEVRGPWQRAWAQFRTGASAIDYVRPNGGGGDSLLLNAGQPSRRSRLWWRDILDQFGASDVLLAEARLERQWPGGPVNASFTARFGPDNQALGSFTLTAPDEAGVPAMLAQAVQRCDQIYTDALNRGQLRPDPTLSLEHPQIDPGLARLIAMGRAAEAQAAAAAAQAAAAFDPLTGAAVPSAPPPEARPEARPSAAAVGVVLQFPTPDARSVDGALAAVRAIGGVQSASIASIALGGSSVMRVNYGGNPADFAAALKAHGWQVSGSGAALRIRR